MKRNAHLALWITSAVFAAGALVLAGGPWGGGRGDESRRDEASVAPGHRGAVDVAAGGPWAKQGVAGSAPAEPAEDGPAGSTADPDAASSEEATSAAGLGTARVPARTPRTGGTPPVSNPVFFPSGSVPSAGDESAEPAKRVARFQASQADDGEADADPLPTRVALVDLEQQAADAALALGLVDPDVLEDLVNDLPLSSQLTPSELERAREDFRRRYLADQAIALDLARRQEEAGVSPLHLKPTRGFPETLLPALRDVQRKRLLDGLAQRLL